MAEGGSVWISVIPSMSGFASTLNGKVGKAGLVAGGVLAGAIGASVVKAIDVSEARAKLTAQLGLTGTESRRYGRVAGQLYSAAYGESLGEVNDALAAVTQNLGRSVTSSNAQLRSVSGTVLNLSKVFGVDLAESTQAVGQLMRTGLAPNAQVALDVITTGLQNGVNKSGDLFDTITEYSSQFQKLGLSAKQSMGLLNQGLKAGARNSDLVADAIKEFSIRAVDGSKLTAQGFQMVGLDAGTMAAKIGAGGDTATQALGLTLAKLRAIPDPVKRSQAAVALFGTQAEDLGQSLYALNPTTAVDALGKVAGAAGRLNHTMGQTASANIEKFKRSVISTATNAIGGEILPAITRLGSALNTVLKPALSAVSSILGPLTPVVTTTGVALVGLAGAIKVASLVARGYRSVMFFLTGATAAQRAATNLSTVALIRQRIAAVAAAATARVITVATKAWAIAQRLLNFALKANPIGIVITAITLLVGALIYAWKNSETFRRIIIGAWNAIKTAALAVFNFLAGFFRAIWTGIRTVAVGTWRAIQAYFVGAFNFYRALFTAVWNAIKGVFAAVWGAIQTTAVTVWNAISGFFARAFAAFTGFFRSAWNGIKAIFTRVWQGIKNTAVSAWNFIKQVFSNAIAFVKNIFVRGFNRIRSFFEGFGRDLIGGARFIWAKVKQAFAAGINAVTGFINRKFIGPINKGLGYLGIEIPIIPRLEQGGVLADQVRQMAQGGSIGGGFATNRPTAIVGEGRTTRPEYVIPTDPRHRRRAVGLYEELGSQLMARGGVLGAMRQVVGNRFPGVVPTSGYRPGDPGYHGRGLAQDFSFPGNPQSRLIPLARWLSSTRGRRALEIIHNPGGSVKNGQTVAPSFWGAGTWANHRDHVHYAASSVADVLNASGPPSGGGGGGFFSAIGGFFKHGLSWIVDHTIKPALSAAKGLMPGEGFYGDFGRGLLDEMFGGLKDKVQGLLGFGGGGGVVPPGRGAVHAQILRAAGPYGWNTGPQHSALHKLVASESSFNPTAQNPVSTAYGLFQFLNSTWSTVGGRKTSNPYQQSVYGMRYIDRRYGNPAAAWAFHRANNYYDQGGLLPPGLSTVYNGTGRPEAVFTDRQLRELTANRGGGALIGQYTQQFYGDNQTGRALDEVLHTARVARRSGLAGRG